MTAENSVPSEPTPAALGDRRPVGARDALGRQTGDGGERLLPVPRRDELPAQLGELSDQLGR